jgi:hypothetical protein
MKRENGWLVTVVTVGTLIGWSSGSTAVGAPTCTQAHNEPVHAYTVDISAKKATVVSGRTATVIATVRHTHDGTPATGARVGVGLKSGDHLLVGGGTTDESGRALVAIKIRKSFPLGWADAQAFAYKEVASFRCVYVEQDGYAERDRLLKVTR